MQFIIVYQSGLIDSIYSVTETLYMMAQKLAVPLLEKSSPPPPPPPVRTPPSQSFGATSTEAVELTSPTSEAIWRPPPAEAFARAASYSSR